MGHNLHPMVRDKLEPMLRDLAATQKQIMGNAERYMTQDMRELIAKQFALLQQDRAENQARLAKEIEVRHYLCDHLGTPQALISQEGEVEWAAALDAWGNVQQEHNPKKLYQPIRLPGQHEDGDTGLHYNRHRYYDSQLGGYINQDPIGFEGGINSYSYSMGNPILITDPTGLDIVYCNHPVAFGNHHSKIVILPKNKAAYEKSPEFLARANGDPYITIGAGPTQGFGGDLLGGFNRDKDVSLGCNNPSVLAIPEKFKGNEDSAIYELMQRVENYNEQTLPYTLFLGNVNEHNSNSFISGILRSSGFNVPPSGTRTPGYEFPVPSERFEPPMP
ncbi:RHS domain-containing protein [Serratia nevei]|uniref:RHS repeat-associated core domain-containing protein n=1 Tax=Serratia nevei TaxID=2703794 RepID=UPI0020A1A4B6|nr:RHS repeat-associated core domain-containing protein [Serratia nevei]MCP1106285.1 RHS domain-containing protein [Serratia nevei]